MVSHPATMYWVYIVASRSGVIYTGVTSDLVGRVGRHQERSVPGFASRYNCNRLVFAESFSEVRDAIACEKKLKGWRRSKKVALINKDNPEWLDISGRFEARSYHPERLQQRSASSSSKERSFVLAQAPPALHSG